MRHYLRGRWRKLHDEKLHNWYLSPNIRMIKSRRMIWAGHVARMVRNVYRIWLESLNGRGHMEDLEVNGTII
jgi:hypothetical protein